MQPDYLAALKEKLHTFLIAHPDGTGEYELLKHLQAEKVEGFPEQSLTEPLPLFRMHFLLHHALYQLRDQLWHRQTGHLEITPLCIRIMSYQAASAALAEPDPLRHYYLDWNNLLNTSADDVTQLLNQFWAKFHTGEQQQAALAVLELVPPVDFAVIKQQYRRLVMIHHPDRGGDTARLQAINQAMAVLTAHYG